MCFDATAMATKSAHDVLNVMQKALDFIGCEISILLMLSNEAFLLRKQVLWLKTRFFPFFFVFQQQSKPWKQEVDQFSDGKFDRKSPTQFSKGYK